MRSVCAGILMLVSSMALAQDRTPVEAVTKTGERVLLHPNGRWEFVESQKAAAAKKIADQFPENQVRPAQAQGGWLGLGRTIMPGDKDYNRGTLNPKMR
jgi:hypothetical protein